jgi:hypothetical protein
MLKTFFWAILTSAVLASGLFLSVVSGLLIYRATVKQTAKLRRLSPRIALLWIGGVGLLTGGSLMLVLATFLE